MENEGTAFGLGLFFGVLISLAATVWILNTSDASWEEDVIKHQAAYYHPETGEFTWKEGE